MTNPKYTAEYFIAKFEKKKKWTVGNFMDSFGACCAMGHCGWDGDYKGLDLAVVNPEAHALVEILRPIGHPVSINDGVHEIINDLGDGAQERIINALTLVACGLAEDATTYET